MASCKECLHYDVCEARIAADENYSERNYTENNNCSNFKDRTRFVELPCRVGDTVYYITGIGHNLVKPAKIKEIIIGENGIKDLYVQGNGHNFENSFDIFFLTREEGEKALKEQKQ